MSSKIRELVRALVTSSAGPRARKSRRERGMNLLEIMVVLVIISLVAGTVGVAVMKQLENAKQKQAKIQIHNLSEALELYKLQFHNYPGTGEGLQALVSPKGNAQPFLNSVPKDPWGRDYVYIYPGSSNPSGFDLLSYGSDGVQSADDITNNEGAATAQQ